MKIKQILLLLSPIVLILFQRLVAIILSPIQSNWVWVPFVLIYWLVIFVFIKIFNPEIKLKGIVNKPDGKWYWSLLALIIGISGISFCLANLDYYRVPAYLFAGFILALINPFFEETYWRKLLIDGFPNKKILLVIYASFLFGLLHLFSFSVISSPNQDPIILPITFAAGVIWSVVYIKTKSLSYIILAHFFLDIFGFSALFIR